jgi:hypothetical protein
MIKLAIKNTMGKLIPIILLSFFIFLSSMAEPAFKKVDGAPGAGALLYHSPMSDATDIAGWQMEGPGILEFRDGWMEMRSPEEQSHHVLWCPQQFPESFIAQWEAQNLRTDAGLCIIFFAAANLNGGNIFEPELPTRDGSFKQYTHGEIRCYHASYYANAPHNPDRAQTNLRKNPGFHLLQEGEMGIPTTSKAIHTITLVKDKNHIRLWVDDRMVIDWKDDGETGGSPHGSGLMGFRQMQWTHFRYRNFAVWDFLSDAARPSAGPFGVNLNFEHPTTLDYLGTAGEFGTRRYYKVSHAYPEAPDKKHRLIQDAEPHPEKAVVRIGKGIGLKGSRGLELEFSPDEQTAEHRNERMELYLAHGDGDFPLRLGEVVYLGYALYVDPRNETTAYAHITQCWQHPISHESFRHGAHRRTRVVPMWMTLHEVDGQFGYSLHVKNEGTPIEGAYRSRSIIAARGTFRAGWNTLIYRFEPRHINDSTPGRITLWVNTIDEANPTADRQYNWGVTPQDELPEGLPDTGFVDRFDVRMGMYRNKQEDSLRLVYDNIRYAKTFKEAIPVGQDEFEWIERALVGDE